MHAEDFPIVIHSESDLKQLARRLAKISLVPEVMPSENPKLRELYDQQYVAVHRGKVVANSYDLDSLLAELKRIKIPSIEIKVQFIDNNPKTLIL